MPSLWTRIRLRVARWVLPRGWRVVRPGTLMWRQQRNGGVTDIVPGSVFATGCRFTSLPDMGVEVETYLGDA